MVLKGLWGELFNPKIQDKGHKQELIKMSKIQITFEELGIGRKNEQVKEVCELLKKANSLIQELTSNSKGLSIEIVDII